MIDTDPIQPIQKSDAQPETAAVKPGWLARLKAASFKKKAAVLTFLVVIIVGGSASAYYGHILPNKPENKLVRLLMDLRTQPKYTVDGSVSLDQPAAAGFSSTYKLSVDNDHNSFDLIATVTHRAVETPIEIKYVDNQLYFKTDLGPLRSIDNPSLDPTLKEYLHELNGVKDQWYVLAGNGSPFTGQGSNTCNGLFDMQLSQKDKQTIKEEYKKDKPLKLTGSSETTVDGQPVTQYDLTVKPQISDFMRNMSNLDFLTSIKTCFPHSSQGVYSVLYNTDRYPLSKISVAINDKNELKAVNLSNEYKTQRIQSVITISWGGTIKISAPATATSSRTIF